MMFIEKATQNQKKNSYLKFHEEDVLFHPNRQYDANFLLLPFFPLRQLQSPLESATLV